MKHFKLSLPRFLLLPLILISLFSASLHAQTPAIAGPEQTGLSGERLSRLTQVFEEYAENGDMAGSVILIARYGRVAWARAFGMSDIESGTEMDLETIFRIASQTKALVSVGIMMLQEEGKLLLQDPAGKYLPEFMETSVAEPREGGYDVVPARRPITLRDLLTHTAGIDYGTGPARDRWEEAGITGWYFADRDEPIAETVSRMASLPMAAHPGERYVYGYSTDILGVIIEKVSGMSLEEFLQGRILDPLGMKDTHFYLPPEKEGRLSAVYSRYPDRPLERAPDTGEMAGQGAYVYGPRKSFSGGAGLLSTAADYHRFLQMLLNGGELDGHRILSRKSVELMTADHLEGIAFSTPGTGFGLGFSIVNDLGARGIPGREGEFGWGGAYGSTYWVDPEEELVVVYFKQLRPTNNLDDREKLRALIYQAITD